MTDSYRTPAEIAELDEIAAGITQERAAAPGLATRYDAACRRITELLEEVKHQRSRIWDHHSPTYSPPDRSPAMTFQTGDRIRTTVTAPAAWDGGYSAPTGSLGTIVATRHGYGVVLDTDPDQLPAHYTADELAPATTTTLDGFLDEPVLPHRSPGSVKTFREMLTEALDTAQAGDRDGAEHLLNEVIGHLGRLQRRPRETTVSNDMLYAITQWLDSVTDLHEQQATGPGCQWCNDEDWPCADTRHAQAVARTMPTTHTEASDE